MPSASKAIAVWRQALYTSAINLSSTGNTGVIASPAATSQLALFPAFFELLGNNMTTDETNTVTVDWYTESTGANSLGTTTFTQLTASTLYVTEAWPGDVQTFIGAANAAVDFAPMPPYMKITYTLAGTTKSMGFTLFGNWIEFHP